MYGHYGRRGTPLLACASLALAVGAAESVVPVEAGEASGTIAAARNLSREGRHREAVVVLDAALRDDTAGLVPAEVWFEKGAVLRAMGDHEGAVVCYGEVLARRPPVDLLRRTLDRKYQVGLDFLQGQARRTFLGIFSYRSPAFGVDILDRLVRDYPFESFSDDALYSIANYYFREGQWAEAQPVYERLIAAYPSSEWVPPAYLQLGKAIRNGIKGYRYDPAPIVRARWHFERFLAERSVGPEAREAREHIRELKDMEARHELYVARFYLRDNNVKGGVIHLHAAVVKGRALDGTPTPAGVEAQGMLDRILEPEAARE